MNLSDGSRGATNIPNVTQKSTTISKIAKTCLIELGVSLAIGTVTFFFTPTLLQGTFIFVAIAVQTACNAWLRYLRNRLDPSRWLSSPQLCVTSFAYLTAINGQALLHEFGRALGARWMFQNANPSIAITPCLGGVTHFATTHLTKWGERMGRNGALCFVTLMGLSGTLLVSSIAIVVGLMVQPKFSELAAYFIGVGKGDFYTHSFHAVFGMIFKPSSIRDLAQLKVYGGHPIIAAVILFFIPSSITQMFRVQVKRQ